MNAIFRSRTLCGVMTSAIMAGAFAASLCVSAAGADTQSVSRIVKYADLEISSPAGAAELYHRIDAAAATVCSYFWFRSAAAEARCINDAIANAVADVNEPALFAVYNLKNAKLRGRRSLESLPSFRIVLGR